MEEVEAVRKAKGRLRSLILNSTKKGSRIHLEAVENNSNRLRALCGICGECSNLKLNFNHKDGKEEVVLRCIEGYSPLKLYENTELGEKPECPGFKERR